MFLFHSHDCVEGLDPHGVDVAVEDDPLGTVGGEVGLVAHDGGEEAVLPLPGARFSVEVRFHGCYLEILSQAKEKQSCEVLHHYNRYQI